MKKFLKGLALATLVATTAQAATDQTFLQVRPHGVNLAMEMTTWRDLLLTKKEDAFGANFQVVPFYTDSCDSSDLGKYFGIDDKNVFMLAHRTVAGYDFDIRYINPMLGANNLKTTIQYEPDQDAYGARIDYHQDLDKVLKGLYFKVALPIVHVDNDMHLQVTNDGNNAVEKTAVEDYFKGTLLRYGAQETNFQEGLKYAKMHGDQDDTEVADIDITLGYKVVNKDNAKLAIEIGFTIPTGNDADGVWVFEPISGNNEHWGLGAGLDFWGKVWEDEDQYFRIDAVLDWRYLFKSSEKRTLRLKDDVAVAKLAGAAVGTYRYSQYRLVAKNNNPMDHVKPLANISTLDVDVTPGSQLDAILGVAYCNGGFSVDLGYNLFWKEREDVDYKEAFEADYFLLDDQGTIPAPDAANALIRTDLSEGSAETPSYLTHKVYGGFGYIFKEWDTPLMLGLGAQYEFASDNEEVENWGIWGKLGVKF